MMYSMEQIKNFRFINGDIGWIDENGNEVKAFKEDKMTGQTYKIKEGGELSYIYGMGFAIVKDNKYIKITEYIAIEKQKLRNIIEEIMTEYNNLRDKLILEKANGDLAKLCNLRDEFDETFDPFFDDKELRIKYDSWDDKENNPDYYISNTDLETMLDCKDLETYILYIKEQIGLLKERGL